MWGPFITSWPVFYSTSFTVAVINRKGQGGKWRSCHHVDVWYRVYVCWRNTPPGFSLCGTRLCSFNAGAGLTHRPHLTLLCGTTLCSIWCIAKVMQLYMFYIRYRKASWQSVKPTKENSKKKHSERNLWGEFRSSQLPCQPSTCYGVSHRPLYKKETVQH